MSNGLDQRDVLINTDLSDVGVLFLEYPINRMEESWTG